MRSEELKRCVDALHALRCETGVPAQEHAALVEHLILWGLACLVADGNGDESKLARDVLDDLCAVPVARDAAARCRRYESFVEALTRRAADGPAAEEREE